MPRKAKSQESEETAQTRTRTVTRKTLRGKKEDMTEELYPSSQMTPDEISEEVREIQDEASYAEPEEYMPEESEEPYEDSEAQEISRELYLDFLAEVVYLFLDGFNFGIHHLLLLFKALAFLKNPEFHLVELFFGSLINSLFA